MILAIRIKNYVMLNLKDAYIGIVIRIKKTLVIMLLKVFLYSYVTLPTIKNTFLACKAAAKMLFTGTLTLGCKSYLDAQKNACYCPSYGWKDSRNKKYTRGDGDL